MKMICQRRHTVEKYSRDSGTGMLPGGGLPLIDCNCNKPTWPTTHQAVVSFENAHTLAFETHFKTNAHISTSVESSFEKKAMKTTGWGGCSGVLAFHKGWWAISQKSRGQNSPEVTSGIPRMFNHNKRPSEVNDHVRKNP